MSASPYSGATLKRSAGHFLIGKVASALLTLSILLWLVRLLAVAEYGAYVTLVAGAELVLAVTSLGLPWVGARYLPDYRLHANGIQLIQFVWQVIARICLFAVIGTVLLFIAMPWLLDFLNLSQQLNVARLYLLVLVLEGLRRNVQECILEPLLQQGHAQFSQVIRNLGLLLFLGVMASQGAVHLHHVVLAELAGTVLGTTSSLTGLIRYLRSQRNLLGKDGWQPPRWSEMWITARHMYFSYLVTLTYSQQAFVFLTQRFLGVETTALFGFLLNLYGQICRYLPATLLFGLIRPKLIASFVGEGGMAQLTRNANLVGKVSLFVLMPLLVFAGLAGEELVDLLSGGKFTQTDYYLPGLLLVLIPFSQRLILETVAVASGHSRLCFFGSALGVLTLPLAYGLLVLGQGLWSPIVAMILSQMAFNTTLITAMALNTTYRPDSTGLFKMLTSALFGFVLGFFAKMVWSGLFQFQMPVDSSVSWLENVQALISGILAQQAKAVAVHGWLDLSVMGVLACGFFLLAAYFFKPFHKDERIRMKQLINNKLR
ncbi:MAG: hypothetical protein PHR16_15495 [Methylovulum sp.]|nr:hypothetical protein [Methylovulum sp.]